MWNELIAIVLMVCACIATVDGRVDIATLLTVWAVLNIQMADRQW